MGRKNVPKYLGFVEDPVSNMEFAMDFAKVVGYGFIGGTSVGSVYHFLKGSFLAEKSRFHGGLAMARANAPRVGGRVAVFSMACMAAATPVHHYMGKDKGKFQPWRPTYSFLIYSLGAASVSVARGPRASLASALLAGSLCALPDFVFANLELRSSRTPHN